MKKEVFEVKFAISSPIKVPIKLTQYRVGRKHILIAPEKATWIVINNNKEMEAFKGQ